MKKWQQYLTAMVVGTLGAVYCANAQDSASTTTTTTTQQNTSPDLSLYRDQEFSIDLFGSGSINNETINHLSGNSVEHHSLVGGGGGVNFFFTRYLGVGGEGYYENSNHHFLDSASGNLIGRLPIGDSGIAPYIFGGGGHQFDQIDQNFGQAGAGIEFRLAQHVGLFLDARYVFAVKTQDYGVGRAGLRFSF
jgi:hypothetical protein